MRDPVIFWTDQDYKSVIRRNTKIGSSIINSYDIKFTKRRSLVPRRVTMNWIENKLLGIVSKTHKEGKLNQWDTLLFNTYYNTLVGDKYTNIDKLFGSAFNKRRASSTSCKSKDKKVRWADQKLIKKRNSMVNTAGLQTLSRTLYGDILSPIVSFYSLFNTNLILWIRRKLKKLKILSKENSPNFFEEK